MNWSWLLSLLECRETIELSPWRRSSGCLSKLLELEGLLCSRLIVLRLLNHHRSGSGNNSWLCLLNGHWFRLDTVRGRISAGGDILSRLAGVGQRVKYLSFHAPVHTGASLNAHVVNLTVLAVAVKVKVGNRVRARLWWTSESHKCLRITIADHIRPFTAVRLLAKSKSFGTVEGEPSAIDTVHELTAVDTIAHLEVAKLVRTLVGGLGRLQSGASLTVDIDGVLAGEVIGTQFVVEQEAIGAQFLLGHAVLAFNVGVTLTSDWICAIGFGTAGGSLLLLLGKLLVLLLVLGLGSKLIGELRKGCVRKREKSGLW